MFAYTYINGFTTDHQTFPLLVLPNATDGDIPGPVANLLKTLRPHVQVQGCNITNGMFYTSVHSEVWI